MEIQLLAFNGTVLILTQLDIVIAFLPIFQFET